MQELNMDNTLHIALNIKRVPECLINNLLDTLNVELLEQMLYNCLTPLHLACWHQNEDIIISILRKHMDAAKILDKERGVSFHLACGQYPILQMNIIDTLMDTHPQSVSMMTNKRSLQPSSSLH